MIISPQRGFTPFQGESGISSTVFEKNGHIYKLTKRNTLERAQNDYEELKKICALFQQEKKLQISEIFACKDGTEKSVVCVRQARIQGQTFKNFGKDELRRYLQRYPKEKIFLQYLRDVFLLRTKLKQKYPDLVGNPNDQSLWNSINLMIEPERGIVICDVGLSPHEDTLDKCETCFFESENVQNYVKQVQESFEILTTN